MGFIFHQLLFLMCPSSLASLPLSSSSNRRALALLRCPVVLGAVDPPHQHLRHHHQEQHHQEVVRCPRSISAASRLRSSMTPCVPAVGREDFITTRGACRPERSYCATIFLSSSIRARHHSWVSTPPLVFPSLPFLFFC
jgi:hypothetical protein